jgi:hypothetical protein
LSRWLGHTVVGGIFVLAILDADILARGFQSRAALVRADEADVGVGVAVASLVVDDDDLRDATDESFRIEFLLLSSSEITTEPEFEESAQCGFFTQRGVEAA